MSLPVIKNPLITKWSTVFDILKVKAVPGTDYTIGTDIPQNTFYIRSSTENGLGNVYVSASGQFKENETYYICNSTITDDQLKQLSEATGITISALYGMLGLSTAAEVNLFSKSGALLTPHPDISGQYIINPTYNSGLELLFNGRKITNSDGTKNIGELITKINLAGTVTPIDVGKPGEIKLQIGDNMNSSSWNTKDGKGSDATVSDVTTTLGRTPTINDSANYSVGNWGTDVPTPFTRSASITYTSQKTTNGKTDGYVHLNDGNNVWRVRVFGADATVTNYNNTTNPPSLLSEATFTDYVTIDYSDKSLEPLRTIPLNQSSGTFFNSNNGKPCSVGNIVAGSIYINNSISSTVVSPMQIEANYPAAVGARIIRNFTINLSKIVPHGGRVTVVIELNENAKAQTLFYLIGYTPNISTLYLYPSTSEFVHYSGIKYFGRGSKFTLKAPTDSITNLNNQLGLHSSIAMQTNKTGQKIIAIDDSKQDTTAISLFNDSIFTSGVATGLIGDASLPGSSTDWNNTCGFLKIFKQLKDDVYSTNPTISLIPANAFSLGSKISSTFKEDSDITKPSKMCLVNTYINSSDNTHECFTSEKYRLYRNGNSWSTWTDTQKETSLATAGNTDLQVIPGVGLVYPSKDYSGFIPSSLAYNTCKGERSFVRKFTKSGSHQIMTFEIKHNKSILNSIRNGHIKVQYSDNGITWYNISMEYTVDPTYGQDGSYGEESSTLTFRSGDASGWSNDTIYFCILMQNESDVKSIIIEELTWTV